MVWPLYGVLVVIWSSTWVAIKIGLEDTPPLLGAGLRFSAAGAALLATAAAGGVGDRCPRCCVHLAHQALVPSTGVFRAPGRHRLTSPATRVTRKIWPASISNTAKDWPTVPAGIRLP
jgi:hypothetical protein